MDPKAASPIAGKTVAVTGDLALFPECGEKGKAALPGQPTPDSLRARWDLYQDLGQNI